jgi:hypothetical protein
VEFNQFLTHIKFPVDIGSKKSKEFHRIIGSLGKTNIVIFSWPPMQKFLDWKYSHMLGIKLFYLLQYLIYLLMVSIIPLLTKKISPWLIAPWTIW